MKKFDIIARPNTVLIKVNGANLGEAIINCAKALSAAMIDQNDLFAQTFKQEILIDALDSETLLFDWLSRLIEIANLESVAVTDVEIKNLSDNHLHAVVKGAVVPKFAREISQLNIDDFSISENEQGIEVSAGLMV